MAALLDTARYAAANAQVRALYTRMVDPFLWRQILDAPDVAAISTLLQQTGWGEEPAPDGQQPRAAELERGLWRQLARLSLRPSNLIAGTPRDLLVWYWRRFEIDNFKTVLRSIHYQEPWSRAEAIIVDLGDLTPISWRALAESDSVQAMVDRLQEGPYKRALDQAMPRYQREHSLFVLEASLDLAYGHRLRSLISSLHGRDRGEAEAYLGFQLDVQNLLWAYRYRIFARLSPEEILNYTLHRGLRVDADIVRRIALGAPLVETVHALWGDRLPGMDQLQALPEREALTRLEVNCERYLADRARHARGGYPLHLGTLLAYLILLEAETQDLTTIIEGRSFGWPMERIQPFLIGNRG
jgi:V/A-type H+-transporting ATPase subunit C